MRGNSAEAVTSLKALEDFMWESSWTRTKFLSEFKVAGMHYNRSLGLVYTVCISGGNNFKLYGILVCLFTVRENLAP